LRILIALLTLLPLGAHAGCPVGPVAILSCTLSAGKMVLDVCLSEDMITFTFGETGENPDLSLQAHVKNADYIPWNGIGRSYYEQVSFHNAEVTYIVWGAVDRLSEDHTVSGGVEVVRGDETLAHLQCDENSAVFGFDAIYQSLSNLVLRITDPRTVV